MRSGSAAASIDTSTGCSGPAVASIQSRSVAVRRPAFGRYFAMSMRLRQTSSPAPK